MASPKEDENGWTRVISKKNRRERSLSKEVIEPTSKSKRAVGHYWNGFNSHGEERWYLELNDGTVITSSHKEYRDLVRRYFPNTHKD